MLDGVREEYERRSETDSKDQGKSLISHQSWWSLRFKGETGMEATKSEESYRRARVLKRKNFSHKSMSMRGKFRDGGTVSTKEKSE